MCVKEGSRRNSFLEKLRLHLLRGGEGSG